jgi:hypothetical protein
MGGDMLALGNGRHAVGSAPPGQGAAECGGLPRGGGVRPGPRDAA